MTEATEYENFLLYTAKMPSVTKLPLLSANSALQNTDDIQIPPRSPDRLKGNSIKGKTMLGRDSPDLTDSSSFEMRLDGSDKSLNESIFSDEDNLNYAPLAELQNGDDDGLDLDDLDDWELLFDELNDDVIFSIDDVVNVVGVHNCNDQGKLQLKPLQCVKVLTQTGG